jgi:hypothetical protein
MGGKGQRWEKQKIGGILPFDILVVNLLLLLSENKNNSWNRGKH